MRKQRAFPRAVRYTLHARYKLANRAQVLRNDEASYVIYDNLKGTPVPMEARESIVFEAAQRRLTRLESKHYAR